MVVIALIEREKYHIYNFDNRMKILYKFPIIFVVICAAVLQTVRAGDRNDLYASRAIIDLIQVVPPSECCVGFVKVITQNLTNSGVLNVTMKAGPKPITKVTLSLVYLRSATDPYCPICKKPDWGVFFCAGCPLGGFVGATDVHWREITWANTSGVDIFNTPRSGSTGLLLDPILSGGVTGALMKCCKTEIEYCIRYSFTDIDCVTCDTVICSKKTIGGSLTPIPNDTLQRQYKLMQQQLKKQNEPDIEEKEFNGEGQGSLFSLKPEYTKKIVYETQSKDETMQVKPPNLGMIWYFGYSAGLSFNGMPGPFNGGQTISTDEGCAAINDLNNNLLLYTDGVHIWNSSNTNIATTPLNGHISSTQAAIIVPYPDGNCNKYYVFTTAAYQNYTDGFCWNLVDFSSNPNGTITFGNTNQRLSNPDIFCEKLSAVSDGNGGYWVIAHGCGANNGDNFYAYKVDQSGLNTNPVRSTIGSVHTLATTNGQMKVSHGEISPGVRRLALVSTWGYFAEIFDFNTGTGIVSNPSGGGPIKLNLSRPGGIAGVGHGAPYGIEFSSNNQFLYISTLIAAATYPIVTWPTGNDPNVLYQFETSNLNNNDTWAAGTQVSSMPPSPGNTPNNYGGLQLGPDGKIYLARYDKSFLGVIKSPDNPGVGTSGCNFGDGLINGQSISGTCKMGLPTIIQGDFSCSNIPVVIDCCKDFKKKVNSTITTTNTFNLSISFSAGPNNIKRIIAEIIDFSTSYNDQESPNGTTNCATCSNNSDNWGNFFVDNPLPAVFILTGKLTVLTGPTSNYGREIVWGNMNGPGVNMTIPSTLIAIKLGLPLKSPSSCCVDTIKLCVRYKFTDVKCITCDTIVCYKIVNSGKKIGMNNNNDRNLKEAQVIIQPAGGQSAGILNLDVSKNSNVKVTIYDTKGKELMKLYDDYMDKGQYTFDLNSYNLPDGVYYYKREYNDKTEYNKILATKPVSGCNCGH
jgi:hypothetical protein